MSDSINIQRRFDSLEKQETFDGYSRVIINVADDVRYISGSDTGRTLEITTPFGTQKMANDILSRVRGFQYQPFTASGAIIDPAVELGDGISADGLYSGIFSKKISFGGLYTADVSAPGGEKINYQVPYKSKQDRTIERNYKDLTTKLTVQAGLISAEVEARKSDVEKINAALKVQEGEISAKVSKTGGNSSSFGWNLLDDSWTLKSNGRTVFQATDIGVDVTGKITATSGKIGGFDITSNSLSYNNMVWGGTNTNGIYIGPNGVQFGRNCRIDSAGNLYATSGTFTGNVYAANIQHGGQAGYFDGDGISDRSIGGGKVGYNTISTTNTSRGINTSLGYADYANGVFNGYYYANMIGARRMHLGDYDMGWTTIHYVGTDGKDKSLRVISGQ